MKTAHLVILLSTALLAACAPGSKSPNSAGTRGGTGYTSPDGHEYVTNGDERVEQARREKPATPTPTPPPRKGIKPTIVKPLRERLKEFEISRYHKNESIPTRFGEDRLTLKFIFRDRASVVFNINLIGAKPKFNANGVTDGFILAGVLNDEEQQSKGEFTLTDNATGDSARIFFWAYKANLKVRQNREALIAPGSDLEKQIQSLSNETFGWVNNWSVVNGVSFYLVDIVKIANPNAQPSGSVLSFKGPSLRTGDAVHDAEELAGAPSKIQLIGNAEEGAGRIFQVTVRDPQTKKTNEFMLDVELDTPPPAPGAPSPQTEPVEEPEVEVAEPPTSPTAPPTNGTPGQPPTQTQPVAPPAGRSFLRISPSLRRTTKMTTDFNKNRNLPGVKRFMESFTNGNLRSDLQRFYTSANPFRRILEKLGQVYDVSPAFAYLTVVESAYFTGGQYKIEGRENAALGPFQFLPNTAREMNLIVGGPSDERRFFVPSACAGAKYIRKLVDKFDDSDSTVAILAYNQGDGGAAAAIYCSYDSNAGNREACASRINRSFTGRDYGRFLALTKRYNYSFAEMDRMAALPAGMRNYVNKKLAVYFISNDLQKYGFNAGNLTELPRNGTVMPRGSLKDRECHGAVTGLL